LVTSDGQKVFVYYFRDFTAPIVTYNEAANFVSFDITCTNIIVAIDSKIKLIAK